MEQKEVVVYARGRRPSCWRTKRLLGRRGYDFKVVDPTEEAGMRPWPAHSSTRVTAPFVFVDGRPAGGLATLKSLARSGDLGRLVRGEVRQPATRRARDRADRVPTSKGQGFSRLPPKKS